MKTAKKWRARSEKVVARSADELRTCIIRISRFRLTQPSRGAPPRRSVFNVASNCSTFRLLIGEDIGERFERPVKDHSHVRRRLTEDRCDLPRGEPIQVLHDDDLAVLVLQP